VIVELHRAHVHALVVTLFHLFLTVSGFKFFFHFEKCSDFFHGFWVHREVLWQLPPLKRHWSPGFVMPCEVAGPVLPGLLPTDATSPVSYSVLVGIFVDHTEGVVISHI